MLSGIKKDKKEKKSNVNVIEPSDLIQEKLNNLFSALKKACLDSNKLEIKRLQTELKTLGQKIDQLYHEAALVSSDFKTIARLFNQRQAVLQALRVPTPNLKLLHSIKSKDFIHTLQKLYPERFKEKELPKRLVDYSTHQLVLAYNQEETSISRQKQLEKLMFGVLEQFAQTKIWIPALMAAVLPLAASANPQIAQQLLEIFLSRLQKSVLLEPAVVEAIGTLIRFANHKTETGYRRALDADALVQVLNLLSERLSKIHRSPSSGHKLTSLLQGLSTILNAMLEQGVCGLKEEKTQSLSRQLRELSEDEELDLDNRFYAAYASEALARLPDEKSVLSQYLGCGLSIAKNIIELTSTITSSITSPDPSALVNSVLALKESIEKTVNVVQRNQRQPWYEIYRAAENLIQSGPKTLAQLSTLFQGSQFKPHENLSFGLTLKLLPLLQHDNPMIRRQVWAWLIRLTGISIGAEKKKEGTFSFSPHKKTETQTWPVSEKVKRRVLAHLKSLSSLTNTANNSSNLLPLIEQQYKERLIKELNTTSLNSSKSISPLLARLPFTQAKAKEKIEAQENSENKSLSQNLESEADVTQLLVVKAYQTVLPLDYRLEQIWEQMENLLASKEVAEDLQYYVPLTGVEHLEELNQENPKLFDLSQKVCTFLEDSSASARLILIQGPSGAGKSLFGRHLQQELWAKYSPEQPIPLFIPLGQLKNPSQRCVEQTLENLGCNGAEIQSLKKERRFILFLDGYDEVKTFKNLYHTNELFQWNAKVVITSRLGYLTGNYQNLFQIKEKESIQEYFIAPFNERQVVHYLNNLVSIKYKDIRDEKERASHIQTEVEKFKKELEALPEVNELIQSPFILKIVLAVLPVLQQQQKKGEIKHITKADIYRAFIEQWYDREELKVRNAKDLKLQKTFKLRLSFQKYAEDLAYTLLLNNQVAAPVVSDEYQTPEEIAEDKWIRFFNENETKIVASRRGIPLKYTGETAQFIHKSLLEYYVACRLIKEITLNREDKPLSYKFYFNQVDLVQEKAIFSFLQDFIQHDTDKIEALFQMVLYSKEHPEASKMATNALSLLAFMRIPFSERNLEGIHASKADLSYGILDHANFQGANLRGSNLQGGWLRGADFRGANLIDVELGEQPHLAHANLVNSVAYSPDGRWIASASGSEIVFWDAVSGEQQQALKGHTEIVMSIVFSPDGLMLASASWDKTIKLWDVKSGKLLQSLEDHIGNVKSIAFSPDGVMLASGSWDKTVKLWEVKNGKLLQSLEGHTESVMSVAFSPDGLILASASWDKTVKLWEVKNGKLLHSFECYIRWMLCIAFSPDGLTLAVGGGDDTSKLWDLKEGKYLNLLEDQVHDVEKAVFNKEGLTQVVNVGDNTLKLWDVKNGKLLQSLAGHSDWVTSIAFNLDGSMLASGSWDFKVKVWDVKSGKLLQTLEGHSCNVKSVAFSPDGSTLISGGEDKTVKLWNAKSTSLKLLEGHPDNVMSIAFSPDGLTLASGSADKTIKLWDVKSGKPLQSLKGHTHWVMSVVFSPDGLMLASGSADKTIKLWDVKSSKLLKTLEGHTDELENVMFSPDGLTLVSCGDDKTIKVWDVKSGKLLKSLAEHNDWVTSIAFSPDGSMLASGSWDKTIKFWDVENGKLLQTLEGHDDRVGTVAFSPNGKILASGSLDKTIKIWNVENSKLLHTLENHSDFMCNVAFSPDGLMLASGSDDTGNKAVKIWNVTNGCLLSILSGYLGTVVSVAWCGNDTLATGSYDCSVRYWKKSPSFDNQWYLLWSNVVSLNAEDCQLEQSLLSSTNARLLQQRGATGSPHKIEKVEEKTTTLNTTLASLSSENQSPEYAHLLNFFPSNSNNEFGKKTTPVQKQQEKTGALRNYALK